MATLFFSDMMISLDNRCDRCEALGFSHRHVLALRALRARGRPRVGGRRASPGGRRLGDEMVYKVGDETGPARLVGGAAPAAIVAVEVLVEQDVVLEMRIGLELLIAAENRTPAVGAAEKEPEQTMTQLVGDLVERQHD